MARVSGRRTLDPVILEQSRTRQSAAVCPGSERERTSNLDALPICPTRARNAASMRKLLISPLIVLAFVTTAWGQVPKHEHVFILVEENQNFSIVIGDSSPMPFLNELASTYAIAASYYATAHPSITNYFMLTTGQSIGKKLKALADLRTEPVIEDNVVRVLKARNMTWKSYAEGLPSAGYIGGNVPQSHYAKRHNPLAYFEKDMTPSEVKDSLVPFPQFRDDLKNGSFANYSFIVPSLINDAHDFRGADGIIGPAECRNGEALGQADKWLREHIAPLIASQVFREKGLLVIVFDEACHDDESDGEGHGDAGGRVAMLIISSKVKPGYRSISLYHHEDTLGLTLEALGLDRSTFPGAAKKAKSMSEFFSSSP
jgi:hypothetical protein